jgi:hypothetical protein
MSSFHQRTQFLYCDVCLLDYTGWQLYRVANIQVRPDRPRPTALLPPRPNDTPEAATAVDKLLMMGMRMPETCWAVFKRQAINPRNCCIWLVDLFEYMMRHGLINPKVSWIFSWPHLSRALYYFDTPKQWSLTVGVTVNWFCPSAQ